MIVLDLFCGGGGASEGYARAGHTVYGVDIDPQPSYPYPFRQGDWREAMEMAAAVDFVHASPPCQGYSPHVSSASSPYATTRGKDEPRLIAEVREALLSVGTPFVIENVYGARGELRDPVLLCGTMFGLPIPRHRLFEFHGFTPEPAPAHPACRGVAKRYAEAHGIDYREMSVTGKGRSVGTSGRWATILDVRHPMRQSDYTESIPPAYTRWIGKQLGWSGYYATEHD